MKGEQTRKEEYKEAVLRGSSSRRRRDDVAGFKRTVRGVRRNTKEGRGRGTRDRG